MAGRGRKGRTVSRVPCPSEAWNRYYDEQEAAAEAAEFIGPIQMFECPKHPGVWYFAGPCDSCYVEEIQESDRLAAEWRKTLGRC